MYWLVCWKWHGLAHSYTQMQAIFKNISSTHREVMFAHHFKVDTGKATYKTSADWYKERRSRSKIEFGTTIKKTDSDKYQEPSEKELIKIIELLNGCKALKIAIDKLDALRN